MEWEPQNGAVRRSRLWVLAASILVVGGLGAGRARADIQVHVMNCADSSKVEFDVYDAKDSVKMVPASSAKVSTGDSSSLHCAGEGKGYCESNITFTGSPDRCYSSGTSSVGMHIDSGKWAVVKGFEVTLYCYPIVQIYDSQPASCEDVCGNCL